MDTITPFLWFDDQAEEAAKFYVGIFPDSAIDSISYYGPGMPVAEGTVMTVAFRLMGTTFTALNGGPDFHFTPAISFVVRCDDQDQLDRYWDSLAVGGSAIQCGWLTDRFGLTWQIVPTRLPEWLSGDSVTSQRVLEKMMTMVKLDIPALEAAYRGE